MLSSKLVSSVKQTVELIDICNRLHKGEEIEGYNASDLPSDIVYEKCIRDLKKVINNEPLEVTKTVSKVDKDNTPNSQLIHSVQSPIMFMGSIPKPEHIVDIENQIVMAKYDGVSIGMRFECVDPSDENCCDYKLVRAHTRGNDVSSTRVTTDVTDKITYLFNRTGIISFRNPPRYKGFDMRGELVLKNKVEGIVSAAYVSGKVNGSYQTFTEADQPMCIVPFEIARVVIGDKALPVTQREAIIMIDNFESSDVLVKPYSIHQTGFSSEGKLEIPEMFDIMCRKVEQPIDGVVYCSRDWTYKETMNVNYGKYAWKPSVCEVVTVKSIEYTIGSTGELSPIIIFDTVTIDAKNYSRAKSAVSKIEGLINNGLGVGSQCVMSLKHNIHPHIESVTVPSLKLFEIPVNCPWCNAKLTHGFDKKTKALLHVVCINESCPELRVQKFTKLIGDMSKLKNINLTFIGKSGKPVRTKISETGLRQLIDTITNTLTLQNVLTKIPNLVTEFNKLNLKDQLVVLGVGGPKAVEKLITKNKWNSINDIPTEMNWLK